jgi:hypothetical protein
LPKEAKTGAATIAVSSIFASNLANVNQLFHTQLCDYGQAEIKNKQCYFGVNTQFL